VYARLMAIDAASMIRSGETIGFGGFTTAGTPKGIAAAIGQHARSEQAKGRKFQIRSIGVATGTSIDGAMAKAVCYRTPYQSNRDLRARIDAGDCDFVDMHISNLTQALRYGFLGRMDWAIVEAADVSPEGQILLTSAVGGAPTFCARAERILVEINHYHPSALLGIHDIYEPADPPHRRELPIYKPSDRIGRPTIQVDPAKIAGVVETDLPDEGPVFAEPTPVTEKIGRNVADFLAREIAAKRLPREFLPVQSGVGNVGNAVLGALGNHPDLPDFDMYTEVVQDAVIKLLDAGRVRFASCSSLTLSPSMLRHFYEHLEEYRPRVVLRPQEITNHPEVLRRLGVISINTALEADIFGNVNSTHVLGRYIMNGIGGSGDFTRNAYISIFTCPSVAKGGKISAIVPMITHVDHSEHSVQVIATEWGVADVRGIAPRKRAELIIDRCAHPDYRDALHAYARQAATGHTANKVNSAFSFHDRFEKTGDMRDGSSMASNTPAEARSELA
jgi:succinate CoA transferase